MCTRLIDPMGIHFLCCAYGIKHMKTHDEVHNTFVAIAWNVNFPMGWKQLHVFPSTMFNSSHQQVNIVLTKDEFLTLVDVVITNPMNVNLFPWSCTTQKFVTLDVASAKERNYCDLHPINQFLLLAIQVFKCLHKQANVFLHNYANVIWSFKRPKGLLLFILIFFSLNFFQLHCKGCKHPSS